MVIYNRCFRPLQIHPGTTLPLPVPATSAKLSHIYFTCAYVLSLGTMTWTYLSTIQNMLRAIWMRMLVCLRCPFMMCSELKWTDAFWSLREQKKRKHLDLKYIHKLKGGWTGASSKLNWYFFYKYKYKRVFWCTEKVHVLTISEQKTECMLIS